MTQSADTYIAENRRDIRRVESNFIEAPEEGTITLIFGRNIVEVEVTGEVYTRPLNDSLIVGHPTASHGIGQGAIGDRRGSWSLAASSEDTAELVRTGRTAVRDALDGQSGGIREAGIGSGTADASTSDTGLQSLSTRGVNAATEKLSGSPSVARGLGVFRFHEHEGSAAEFAIYDTGGDLLSRLTFSGVSPTNEQEVRVIVSMEVVGSGIGDSVITNDGEEAIADSIHFPKQTVGLNEIAFGNGSVGASFVKSSSSLSNEVIRKNVIRDLSFEEIIARTRILEGEPASQPVDLSEAAVYDNASTPRMIWATSFSPEEKTDDVTIEASIGFRVE